MASLYPHQNNNNSFDNINIDKCNNKDDGANNNFYLDSLNNNKNVLESSAFANSNQPQIIYSQPPVQIVKVIESNEGGSLSFILFVIGFFLPLCWLINLIHIKSRNRRAKKYSILSIVLFCVLTVCLIIISASTR